MDKNKDNYHDKYDYAYDADNEYDIDDDEDNYPQISRQTFVDIGVYMMQHWGECMACEMDLHECRDENTTMLHPDGFHVGACRPPIRSISSELFSLCSNETDSSVFKYYISDDEINVELT